MPGDPSTREVAEFLVKLQKVRTTLSMTNQSNRALTKELSRLQEKLRNRLVDEADSKNAEDELKISWVKAKLRLEERLQWKAKAATELSKRRDEEKTAQRQVRIYQQEKQNALVRRDRVHLKHGQCKAKAQKMAVKLEELNKDRLERKEKLMDQRRHAAGLAEQLHNLKTQMNYMSLAIKKSLQSE